MFIFCGGVNNNSNPVNTDLGSIKGKNVKIISLNLLIFIHGKYYISINCKHSLLLSDDSDDLESAEDDLLSDSELADDSEIKSGVGKSK